MTRTWLAAFSTLALAASPAVAGSGNSLYLVQQGEGLGGNTFQSDQSAGTRTTIGTLGDEALQRGSLNSASLTISGDCIAASVTCAYIDVEQDNATGSLNQAGIVPVAPMSGNRAIAAITGTGTAAITQLGDDNLGRIETEDGHGTISQSGLSNTAKLQISGPLTGTITQVGNGNFGGLAISGLSSAEITLTQQGNGLSYGGSAPNTSAPITVFSTGDVSITQTSF